MNRYKIGNVEVNLDYFKGSNLYSDGDIEDEIFELVQHNEFDAARLLSNDNRWPILYHFSPVRRNLLEWFDFSENAKVLEIGAGCGALTGLLSEKAAEVTAVELSKRRAEIIAHRYKDRSNIEIIVGNLNEIAFEEKFDYITLIGVLEYAAKFTESHQPFHDFLSLIRGLLKPNGILFIAIENKFGLKYWAGATEDHTGILFDGLENYPSNQGVNTFSNKELRTLLQEAGFGDISFYYPMPDYKLPTAVYSDAYLPSYGQVGSRYANYNAEKVELFNESKVLDNIIKNEKFDFFANSFLVLCK